MATIGRFVSPRLPIGGEPALTTEFLPTPASVAPVGPAVKIKTAIRLSVMERAGSGLWLRADQDYYIKHLIITQYR